MTLPFVLPRLLPAPSAAAYIGVSETKLRELGIRRRVLGGKRLFDRLDLDAYVDGLSFEGDEAGNSCDSLFGGSG